MKKLAFFAALAALTTMASASSLTWGYGGGYLYLAKPGDTVAVQAGDFTGEISDEAAFVLVYLGSSSTLDVGSITAEMVADHIDLKFEVDPEYNDAYVTPQDKPFSVGGKYNEGDYFGIAFYDGTKYSAIYDVLDYDERTIGSALSPVVQITSLDDTADFSLSASAGGTTDSEGYHMAGVTVPEPSVAILGLLGLGMLIKRRKA